MADTFGATAQEVRGASRETLANQTLQQLLNWLKQGKFPPGSKLPSQNELIERFGISRTGIREALQMMSVLNLIEIRPGLGCFVKKVSPEYIVNADVLAILLEKEAVLEVIETRKILEAGIAALAAERATAEDFWNIEDSVGRLERCVKRGESVAHVAPEVHYAIAQATHNCVLSKLVRSFTHLMAKAGELLETSTADLVAFKQNELDTHRQLYEIIREGDPQKARIAMAEHIQASEGRIVDAFLQVEDSE